MRSSRISRETAEVMAALSSPSSSTAAAVRQLRRAPLPIQDIEDTLPGTPPPKRKRPLSTQSPQTAPSSVTSERKRSRRTATTAQDGGTTSTSTVTTVSTSATSIVKSEPAPPPKPRRKPAHKVRGDDGNVKIEPPTGWEALYAATKAMRAKGGAPVDTMGCSSLARERATPRARRFQTLVALMLSSQTKDTITAVAVARLDAGLEGGLCVESVHAAEEARIAELIYGVGFWRRKAVFLKGAAKYLLEDWKGEVPDSIEGLLTIAGVGPKMAYLCLSEAWGKVEGIGVDVHVHRITNLWGWHRTKEPEETRQCLQSWLPREEWFKINPLLVGLGQTICLPVGRKCGECNLGIEGLCPTGVRAGASRKGKSNGVSVKEEIDIKTEADGDSKENVKLEVQETCGTGASKVKIEAMEIKLEEIEGEPLGRRRTRSRK